MTSILRPSPSHYEAWVGLLGEFAAEDSEPHGSGQWMVDGGVTEVGFAEWLAKSELRADVTGELEGTAVHCDQFLVADGDDLVGFIQLRHELNAFLLEEGGHIGYSVRPSRRREGHAGNALDLVLDRARELGIERVLITCDEDNVASARTIESRGGVVEDVRKGKRRHWIVL